jgi:hypothetical protein
MIGVACFALVAVVVGIAPIVVLFALDRRDERRRRDRLTLWYDEHGGGDG